MKVQEIRQILTSNKSSRILIASHRGKFGASVMENTVLSFLTAIGQGADMVEMDLDRTKDGILIGHHDDTMDRLFKRNACVREYTYEEIKTMPIYNVFGEPCIESINTFDEILTALKGKTMLVLDKCWDYWEEIASIIQKYGMENQIIMKFYIENKASVHWSLNHPEFLYIPMVANPDDKELLYEMKKKTSIVGMEILPNKAEDLIMSEEYLAELHAHGLKVWCNSLSLSSHISYGGGYDDLKSLQFGGDTGWGELIKRGVDIIQTDWVYELRNYLKKR